MARRSKKTTHKHWIYLVLGLSVLGFGGAMLFHQVGGEPFRTVDNLDVGSYMENSNSLRGNVYRLDAEVLNALAMSPVRGRLISVSPEDSRVVPLIVPSEFNHLNIQKGQRFVFVLEVDERGLLKVRDMTKV